MGIQLTTASLGGVAFGRGLAFGHHGEIIQGVLPVGGTVRNVLVTLPCVQLCSEARFTLERGAPVRCKDRWRRKAIKAAELTFAVLDRREWGGYLEVESNIRIGRGLGSSSADVTATILAVANAVGRILPASLVGRIAVEAEVASDPLVYGQQLVVFAQCDGVVLEMLPESLPAFELLSIHLGAEDEMVNTLGIARPVYAADEQALFKPLLGLLRCALRRGDLSLLGHVATVSATINQRYHPKPHFDTILDIAMREGAHGVQIAHSGTMLGIIFEHGAQNRIDAVRRRVHDLLGLESTHLTMLQTLRWPS